MKTIQFTLASLVVFLTLSTHAHAAQGQTLETAPAKAIELHSIDAHQAAASEDWKGHTVVRPYEFGAMTGLSLYGSKANWGLLGTAAYLLKDKGWAQDLDNRLWVEVELGPAFFSVSDGTHAGLQYSAHLRWDFTLNEYWTFYGLGGLGGFVLPSALGSSFTIHPRFGGGAEYQTKTALMFRAEVSEDFTGFGVAFNF